MISIHILIVMLLILGTTLVPLVYFKKTKHISLLVFLLGESVLFIESSSGKYFASYRLQPQADGTIALQTENLGYMFFMVLLRQLF